METEIVEIEWSWDNPVIQELLLKYYREWLFNSPEIVSKMVEKILSLSGAEPPAHMLDIGCGLGDHAIDLREKGFQVYAFDPGNKYIEIAKKNAVTENVDVSFEIMSCSELSIAERFSLAWAGWYCPGQRSRSELVQDFKKIYESLLPGGWFVSTVAGKQKMPPMEKVRNWRQLSDCFALSEKWADETHFHEHSWFVYPETNKVIKIVEVEKMYGVTELTPILSEAGFTDITTAKDLTGKEPAEEGAYFAFWCRKKE